MKRPNRMLTKQQERAMAAHVPVFAKCVLYVYFWSIGITLVRLTVGKRRRWHLKVVREATRTVAG